MTEATDADGGEAQIEIADGPLPPFAANHDEMERYTVIRDTYHTQPDRIRVCNDAGLPKTDIVIELIEQANTQGWRLDKHVDHGQELQFVPFEDGDEQEGGR